MTVVDTNVVAYFLLETDPYVAECREFFTRHEALEAPASMQAELVNTIWMAVRHDLIDVAEGTERLRLAAMLGIQTIPVGSVWEAALARAHAFGHPAYDTLFVEAAVRGGTRLATFDQRLLDLFPKVCARPRDL